MFPARIIIALWLCLLSTFLIVYPRVSRDGDEFSRGLRSE
jgi:hypothetical protein